jgi:FAD/FMN-containing dehydrogenase
MTSADIHPLDTTSLDLVRPGDDRWDEARRAFNLTIDQRPDAVAFPDDAGQVGAAVRAAQAAGSRVAVQATGHNAGPLGPLGGTIIVNTSRLTEVRIDAAARRVRVGAGVKWERVVPALSRLGLAALHGSSPDVGIVGYALGGGMGWLARKHGLHASSVTAIELVTADGQLRRVDAYDDAELFWALRGGGGNFGAVTALEFEVLPVPTVYAGAMLFPAARAAEVLHTWHGSLGSFPEELMTWANVLHFPDLPEVPEPVRGGAFTVVMGVHLGTEAQGRDLLRDVRDLGPTMDTFAMVPPVGLAELAMDPPAPIPYLGAHRLLDELSADAIDAFATAVAAFPLTVVQLRHMGGALARPTPNAGARATLPGTSSLYAAGVAVDEASSSAVSAALDAITGAVASHVVGEYPNLAEHPGDPSRFFDDATWSRLRAVKSTYDPEDLFKGNHPVPPAPGDPARGSGTHGRRRTPSP